jgi:hypothetical protein
MKTILTLLTAAVLTIATRAAATIDASNRYAWGANLGWTNWRDASAGVDGAVVGEYVCSGYVWSANVGWIHLGNGAPADGIRYSNSSGTDFGVNLQEHFVSGGVPRARLRGMAYGANIGWISFEPTGNPQLSLSTGRLSGYAWSANCGWINLGDATFAVQTNTIVPGTDTDGDAIADAFEFQFTNPDTLTLFTATSDFDGDGASDLDEYASGTDPLDPNSSLRIIAFDASEEAFSLTWTSSPTRRYRIQTKINLLDPAWTLALDNIPPDGTTTTRAGAAPASTQRFFRVQAFPPLAP